MRTLAIVLVALAGCAPEATGPTVTPLIAPAEPPADNIAKDEEPAPSDMTPPAAAPGGVEPPADDPPGEVPSDMPDRAGTSGQPQKDLRIGLPACDAYMNRYVACEPQLKPEIMSGRRRFPAGEAAWLKHMRTESKDTDLADACKRMLEELQGACKQPVKSP